MSECEREREMGRHYDLTHALLPYKHIASMPNKTEHMHLYLMFTVKETLTFQLVSVYRPIWLGIIYHIMPGHTQYIKLPAQYT